MTRTQHHELSMRGKHGDLAISLALGQLGSVLDDHAWHIGIFEKRIAALEAANSSTENEDIKRALFDAHNAIEKALNHFRTTAENHKK